jgi:hypothetical protein
MANHESTCSAHELACSASKELCQQLFEALNQIIPNLKYNKGPNKCKITYAGARKVPVWITHSTRVRTINVYSLGNPKPAMQFAELKTHLRERIPKGSWKDYPGSLMIENDKQLQKAVELLVKVSFPAALE